MANYQFSYGDRSIPAAIVTPPPTGTRLVIFSDSICSQTGATGRMPWGIRQEWKPTKWGGWFVPWSTSGADIMSGANMPNDVTNFTGSDITPATALPSAGSGGTPIGGRQIVVENAHNPGNVYFVSGQIYTVVAAQINSFYKASDGTTGDPWTDLALDVTGRTIFLDPGTTAKRSFFNTGMTTKVTGFKDGVTTGNTTTFTTQAAPGIRTIDVSCGQGGEPGMQIDGNTGANFAVSASLTNVTFTFATNKLTKTGGFTNAEVGQQVRVTAGTGVTTGLYTIATWIDADNITLTTPITAGGSPTDVSCFCVNPKWCVILGTRFFMPSVTNALEVNFASIGGFTTADHANTSYCNDTNLGSYLSAMGATHIGIWLGENPATNESAELIAGPTSATYMTNIKALINRYRTCMATNGVANCPIILFSPYRAQSAGRVRQYYQSIHDSLLNVAAQYSNVYVLSVFNLMGSGLGAANDLATSPRPYLVGTADPHPVTTGIGSCVIARNMWDQLKYDADIYSGNIAGVHTGIASRRQRVVRV